MRKAFTFVEVVFVIAIIGILSGIAIPRFMGTTNQANLANGKNTVEIVRAAINTERQKRILRGDFTPITRLYKDKNVTFDFFSPDGRGIEKPILQYPSESCDYVGCWEVISDSEYKFHYDNDKSCTYTFENNLLKGKCPSKEDGQMKSTQEDNLTE